MNELSIIFNKLEIDTHEVIAAASTKWNFLPFSPGLVGGHCIGVDPYYLTHKAKKVGYLPEVILAGRAINDSMSIYVVDKIIEEVNNRSLKLEQLRVLILGMTFKENCPDIRNTKVTDIFFKLKSLRVESYIYDPWVDVDKVRDTYDIECLDELDGQEKYNVIILATPHKEFISEWETIKLNFSNDALIYDLKGCLPKEESDFRL